MRSRRRRNALGSIAVGIVAALAIAGIGLTAAWNFGLVPASVVSQLPLPTATRLVEPSASPDSRATPTTATTSATASAPVISPSAAPTPAPRRALANDSANRYLQAWQRNRFPDMYRMLSKAAAQNIAEDRFVGRYQAITVGASINSLRYQMPRLLEPAADVDRVEARFTVTFDAARLGEFSEENSLPLVFENGDWRVEWMPGLIFRDLTPDRTVRFFPENPVRGAILDRNGVPLAAQGKAVTLGMIPGRIKDQNLVVTEVSKFLGINPDVVRRKLADAKPDWWVPLRDFPLDRVADLNARFAKIEGVFAEEKDSRVYPHGQAGAHVIGFVSPVTADDMKTLAQKGYEEGDFVGRGGIEIGAEEVLAGVRGGRLVVQTADGDTARVIAERPARNGGNVRLTIDIEVQKKAEQVLGDQVGSIVMMDPRDNSVVALVSRPAFDPNGFIFGFSDVEWKKLSDDPRRPFQARANMSTYATGSVYKVVSIAAALEKGVFRANSMFDCNGKWAVLNPRNPMGDWKPQGHGKLDLAQGLVESCDIVFYEIGHKLDQLDSRILPEFTHAFGFGEPTGIQGLKESEGIVPSPDWKKRVLRQEWFPGDAVNLSIGQGYLDATPLQVANAYAALANGGVLRTPLLIRTIIPGDGSPPREFKSVEKRRLPVSGQNIATIRDALKRVASTPSGTANYAFQGYAKSIAAKTGSAENQNPDAHAWFAGYGPAEEPSIVVIVMVEGGRLGGTVAAPLGRKVFEIVLGK